MYILVITLYSVSFLDMHLAQKWFTASPKLEDGLIIHAWEYRKCFSSLSSAHEKWDQKQKSSVYIFVQYILKKHLGPYL